jgi:hypothetical protein
MSAAAEPAISQLRLEVLQQAKSGKHPGNHSSNMSISSEPSTVVVDDYNGPTNHFFMKHGFSSASLASMDPLIQGDSEKAAAQAPERVFIRTQMYVTILTLVFLGVVAGWSIYNLTMTMLARNAFYAAFVYVLIPSGEHSHQE